MTQDLIVYPRLKKPDAVALAQKLQIQPIADLRADYSHELFGKAFYAATGNRAQEKELRSVQQKVRSCAEEHGYPSVDMSNDTYGQFDSKCAEILHQSMRLAPYEASSIEVWSFLTCVLLPDIVRWRYFEESTSLERFIGANRGLRRNTLGRLWWRAFLLHKPQINEPYRYLYALGEDDLVQLTERSSIASDPILISSTAEAFITMLLKYPGVSRRELMREAVKRLRRLVSILTFEALHENEVAAIVHNVFDQTAKTLSVSSELVTLQVEQGIKSQ